MPCNIKKLKNNLYIKSIYNKKYRSQVGSGVPRGCTARDVPCTSPALEPGNIVSWLYIYNKKYRSHFGSSVSCDFTFAESISPA